MGVSDKVLESDTARSSMSSLSEGEKKMIEKQIRQICQPFDQLSEVVATELSKPGAIDALRKELLRIKAGT